MFGALRSKGREKTGVLAARQAVSEPHHPRVAEPSAASVLAKLGAPGVAAVGADATALDALKLMAEQETAAVAVTSPDGLVGVFSERDHARNKLTEDRAAKDTPVADVMTRIVACAAGRPACVAASRRWPSDASRRRPCWIRDGFIGLLSADRSAGGRGRLSRAHLLRDRGRPEADVPARRL